MAGCYGPCPVRSSTVGCSEGFHVDAHISPGMAGPHGLPDSHLLAWVLVAPWKSTITKVTLIGPYLQLWGFAESGGTGTQKAPGHSFSSQSVFSLWHRYIHSFIHSPTSLTHTGLKSFIYVLHSFTHAYANALTHSSPRWCTREPLGSFTHSCLPLTARSARDSLFRIYSPTCSFIHAFVTHPFTRTAPHARIQPTSHMGAHPFPDSCKRGIMRSLTSSNSRCSCI